jgi:hypothetical protein
MKHGINASRELAEFIRDRSGNGNVETFFLHLQTTQNICLHSVWGVSHQYMSNILNIFCILINQTQ